MIAERKIEIYMDGSCPFCQWSRAHIQPWDTRGRLKFLDYNNPATAAQAPYSIEELGREMHVRGPDSAWAAGFAAWAAILRVLPSLTWLGWAMGMPPLRWVGPILYRWVARHRQLLPGVPQACPPKIATPGRRAT